MEDQPRSSTGAMDAFLSLCFGLAVVVVCFGLAAVVLAFGCEHTVDFDKGKENGGAIIPGGALYASVVGTGKIDVSRTIEEVDSEEKALEAFFRAKDLLAKGDCCDRAMEARGNYAQAKVLFEKSMKFYIPDLQAMTLGRDPVHPSANWHFLRALHDYWGKASALSGRSTDVAKIEENAKDAWALAVIQEMTRGMSVEEKRRLTAGTFRAVKNELVSQMKRSERFTLLGESISTRIQTEVARGLPFTGKRHSEVVGDGESGTNMSKSYELRMDRIRKAHEQNEVQRMARVQSASHLSGYCFYMGDPANGSVSSVRVPN
ncbi:MAG: hypothetical protein HZA88_11400 [Verrucomicrobia bacterium]|nr:hypothetical protein [Verrucomicrobiota bacterium]